MWLDYGNKILGIVSLFLFFFGLVGNILTFFVCQRKPIRNITTFRLLKFISISDIFALSVWNIDVFLMSFFGFAHEYISGYWCKIAVFLQYFCLQYSAWLLVSVTYKFLINFFVQRFLSQLTGICVFE